MPMEVAPAARRSAITDSSPGGSICTWIGSPGTASSTARTRAPGCGRRGPAGRGAGGHHHLPHPVHRTAASATSANWAGVFAAIVLSDLSDSSMAQKRHRWSSAYRMQVCTTVVAALAPVQQGDLLVGDAVGGAQVVELRPAHGFQAQTGVPGSPVDALEHTASRTTNGLSGLRGVRRWHR